MSRSKSLAARLGLVADYGDGEGELGGLGAPSPLTERGESQESAHEEAETQRLITSSMVSPPIGGMKSCPCLFLRYAFTVGLETYLFLFPFLK